MTGSDPLPVAVGAVARIAENSQQLRNAESAALLDAAKGSTELDHAATIKAKRLAVREQFLLQLWSPVRKFIGASKEYFEFDFPGELAAKLEGVPDEQLQTPKASIVAPAMEALGYSLDEPSLKDMYLNLLAGASNAAKAPSIHPSFIDTVRQLSADEASSLDYVLRMRRLAVVRIRRVRKSDGAWQIVHPCIIGAGDPRDDIPQPGQMPSWVNNWERLGLVEVSFTEHLVSPDTDVYQWAEQRIELRQARAAEPVPAEGEVPEWRIELERGRLDATSRGIDFFAAVHTPT